MTPDCKLRVCQSVVSTGMQDASLLFCHSKLHDRESSLAGMITSMSSCFISFFHGIVDCFAGKNRAGILDPSMQGGGGVMHLK